MSSGSWIACRASSGCGSASTKRAPASLELGTDRLGAGGQLGPGRAHAHPDLAARFVQAMEVAPDDGQRESHGASLFVPMYPNPV